MDLFQAMRAFVVTVESGSMSGAASVLGITPAMIGQHIAALENRLGVRLLNRTTRRQSLTDFGQSYLEQCRDILERIEIADLEAECLQQEPRGLLRVTAPHTFGASLLIPALGQYRRLYPEVQIDLILSDQTLDVVEQAIDVAFRLGQVADSRMVQRRLCPYRMIVCAAPEYLDEWGVPEHPQVLGQYEMIGFSKHQGRALRFERDGDQVEISPRISISVNSGHALLNAARAGMGLIVQPQMLVADDLRQGRLRQVLDDWHSGERSLSLVYYRQKLMTPRVRSFIDFAVQRFGT
jgi:DNA-binding transcriptional LysR family regulator